ncbi:YhdH/YhfP family quinone oxidoreductase [Balneola vulgaris]|uniref:YhdH/YhfP family quinone oxidoreductase n=1 Tax=Balneola vulgaris TaxID=287535 RepID=UPI00037AE92C|nr:YhdH/YhfP family quinone oxidoreductase [Balneola vulgaris]
MSQTFRALWVQENDDQSYKQSIQDIPLEQLPNHEVLIQVHYSSLNYKDGLSASGNKGVTRSYPFIPGIDASGVVMEDSSGNFQQGDQVLVTGYDLGMNTFGGFGEYIRVPASWVVPLPEPLNLEQAMVVGTAGYTAAYGVLRLERELVTPNSGPVLVTGATGGVGSMAVYFLAQKGFEVIAATGKLEQSDLLKQLGAHKVIHRDEVYPEKQKLLNTGLYAGAIETVGGKMLEALIPQMMPDGAIACCGNILGHELHSNVYPFILRGLSLLGIDSGITKMPLRLTLWDRIAESASGFPNKAVRLVSLEQMPDEIDRILNGKQIGRVVLKHEF